jgi:HAD superfamily hydrolase (TIGR01458 family)
VAQKHRLALQVRRGTVTGTLPVVPDSNRPLAGVRGLLLDLDGVLILAGRPIPGAVDALAELERRGVPYRIVTNTSLWSRVALARYGESVGMPVSPDRILSALSVSAAYTRRHYERQPLYVLASEDARSEFAGQWLLSNADAAAPGARAAAVVVGDSPEEATYGNLNAAFRLLRGGAELIGMHNNRWWITADGPTLDSGAFVAGLEFASGRKAVILGKPAAAFFGQAARELQAAIAATPTGRVARRALAMVGDDLWTDVLAAQGAGLRGVFVLSGKGGRDDLLKAATQRRGGGRPALVANSLADVVAALD